MSFNRPFFVVRLLCVPLIAFACCATTVACQRSGNATAPRRLLPISWPADLAQATPAVQAQIRASYTALQQQMSASAAPSVLGTAYGRFGMLLQAAEYDDAAEPCYLNAQTLAPTAPEWPYYLAQLARRAGHIEQAEASFKRVLALRPDDLPSLIWLGRLDLDTDHIADAEILFARAFTLAPRMVAVLAGLGRVALARKQYAQAAAVFEDALKIEPQAESLHAPLAAAYRALGALDKAGPHARGWGNTDIVVPDPRQQEIYLLLESGLSDELRGVRALNAHDWRGAAEYFRHGLALTPENGPLRRSLQHKLGTALYLSGNLPGAEEQFLAVVRAQPLTGFDESAAKAHFSLGVLAALRGHREQAIAEFLLAIHYQPSYVEAQQALADVLRQVGRAGEALAHYDEALKLNSQLLVARLGYAVALTRLGRDREARDWLDESIRQYPDQPLFQLALARVLVAARDDRVRDGTRAMSLVQNLLKGEKTIALGETVAMTFAELGDYRQAAAIQRDVLMSTRHEGTESDVRRITGNLRHYEQHEPCRVPWTDDEEINPTDPSRI